MVRDKRCVVLGHEDRNVTRGDFLELPSLKQRVPEILWGVDSQFVFDVHYYLEEIHAVANEIVRVTQRVWWVDGVVGDPLLSVRAFRATNA